MTQSSALACCVSAMIYPPSLYSQLWFLPPISKELVSNQDGGEQGSLLWLLPRCSSAAGQRLLRQWILHPLIDPHAINARYVG